MRYLLDTDTCIYIVKRAPEYLYSRFKKLHVGDVGVSAITYCELQYGVAMSRHPEKNQAALNEFLAPLEVLDFPSEASAVFGMIRAHLSRQGTPIGNYDLLIAAHAFYQGLVLITNNVREFSRVPDLKIENWIEREH